MASKTPTLAEMLEAPAMEAPDGVVPNFEDPPNQNRLALAIITLTMAIATLCLLLRAYARVYLLRKVQIEEILIFCAYGVYWGQTYCSYRLLETPGYFVHQWNLKAGQLIPAGFDVLLIGSFYQVVLPLLKTAILIEWCRLFAPPGNRVKSAFWWGCVSIIVLQIVWGIVCVVLLNVQCDPHEAIWKFYLQEPGKCFNLVPVQLTSGAVQLFSDCIMLLLPQKIIWSLKLSWKKRLGVSLVFGLGILAAISAGFRLGVTVSYGYDEDQMYQLAPVVFWVMAETTCGFFIVCIPCMSRVFKDTGLTRKIKQRLGMSVSTTGMSGNPNLKYGYGEPGDGSKYGASVSGLSRAANTTEVYHQLDEERGYALGSLKSHQGSDTEPLRPPENARGKIMRETEFSVQVSSDRNQRENRYPA